MFSSEYCTIKENEDYRPLLRFVGLSKCLGKLCNFRKKSGKDGNPLNAPTRTSVLCQGTKLCNERLNMTSKDKLFFSNKYFNKSKQYFVLGKLNLLCDENKNNHFDEPYL